MSYIDCLSKANEIYNLLKAIDINIENVPKIKDIRAYTIEKTITDTTDTTDTIKEKFSINIGTLYSTTKEYPLTITRINGNSIEFLDIINLYNQIIKQTSLSTIFPNLIVSDYNDKYVKNILRYYYHSIILISYYVLIDKYKSIYTTQQNDLIEHIIAHINNNVITIDLSAPINKYNNETNKLKVKNATFLMNNKSLKYYQKEINNNKKNLKYITYTLILTIVITFLILCISIYFKKNITYLIFLLLLLIIINFTFIKYVVFDIIEPTNKISKSTDSTDSTDTIESKDTSILEHTYINNNCSLNSGDDLSKQLYKFICGIYLKLHNSDLDVIDNIVTDLKRENYKYEKLKLESSVSMINKENNINNDILTFYQRKEYTSLFIRLITLLVLILLLLNIFDNKEIIIIFGFVFCCLILMVYLYNIKIINRIDSNKKNWSNYQK